MQCYFDITHIKTIIDALTAVKQIFISICTIVSVENKLQIDYVMESPGAQNFLTTHAGFVSPSYVLQDNVTLYYLTKSAAVFVETREDVDIHHSDTGSFMRAAQFDVRSKFNTEF